MDEPTVESVVAVAGAAFTPERVAAGSIEGAVQILLLPGPPNPTREGTGFGGEDDRSLEELKTWKRWGESRERLQGIFLELHRSPAQPQHHRSHLGSHSLRRLKIPPLTAGEAQQRERNQLGRVLIHYKTHDCLLEPILVKFGSGEEGGDYSLGDEGIFWPARKGESPKLAITRAMTTGVLALVHSTFGHPGVACTTLLVQGKYNWPTLVEGVRDYMLSCGCRRRKRASSQRVAMMPARFLRPWEVLEMDIQDLKQESQAGNGYMLVVVDRASKCLFAYPLPF